MYKSKLFICLLTIVFLSLQSAKSADKKTTEKLLQEKISEVIEKHRPELNTTHFLTHISSQIENTIHSFPETPIFIREITIPEYPDVNLNIIPGNCNPEGGFQALWVGISITDQEAQWNHTTTIILGVNISENDTQVDLLNSQHNTFRATEVAKQEGEGEELKSTSTIEITPLEFPAYYLRLILPSLISLLLRPLKHDQTLYSIPLLTNTFERLDWTYIEILNQFSRGFSTDTPPIRRILTAYGKTLYNSTDPADSAYSISTDFDQATHKYDRNIVSIYLKDSRGHNTINIAIHIGFPANSQSFEATTTINCSFSIHRKAAFYDLPDFFPEDKYQDRNNQDDYDPGAGSSAVF